MAYSINQIKNNTWNHYKYHYLDHGSMIIDLRENYWDISMNLFSINNFSLPINSLAGDLYLPYQKVEGISFNLASDQSKAKEYVVHNKDYCKIFTTQFTIDISANEFFKQDLDGVKVDFNLGLFIDPEAAKAAGSLDQDALDALMNETFEQRWSFEAYYTNTHVIKQSEIVDNLTGYTLEEGNKCMPVTRKMNVSSVSFIGMTKPINNLAHIESLQPFKIISAKVKFFYWIELVTEPKTLEKVLDVSHEETNSIAIELNDYTLFDYEKNEVTFNPIGVEGFNIPQYSRGYYQLELQIEQTGAINKFIINNDFSFNQSSCKPFISVCYHRIESFDDEFKEVKFND